MTIPYRSAAVALVLFFMFVAAPLQAGAESSLFINLTSDATDRAAMAINFGHRVLKKKKIPVTLFLNVEGVRLVDKNIPPAAHASGQNLHEMLQGFMADGGKVVVCPMCMKNVGGLTKEELLEGVAMGGPDTTWAALFAENVTVLSY